MDRPAELANGVQAELDRRHRITALTIHSLLVVTPLLSLFVFAGKGYLYPHDNPSVDVTWKICVVIFGLGSIVLRRTRFAAMRLKDIGALRGPIGLIITLEKTTLQLAVLGAVIAVMGFICTLMTGNPRYTYGAGLVAIVVLLYCYPTKTSWRRTVQQFAQE